MSDVPTPNANANAAALRSMAAASVENKKATAGSRIMQKLVEAARETKANEELATESGAKEPKKKSLKSIKYTDPAAIQIPVQDASIQDLLNAPVKKPARGAKPTDMTLREAYKENARVAREDARIAKEKREAAAQAEAENKANILDFAVESQGNAEPEKLSSPPDDGIEILCQMATKGEIDPKNVDIIDVCDKFLKAIASTPKESLRMSGKVIFHAAVLLRLKAEALLSEATNSMSPVVDDFLDFDDDGAPIDYDSDGPAIARQLTFKDLEGAIVRRSQRKQQVRERRVTLEQLIAALKEAEKLETVRHEKKAAKPRIDLSGYNEVHDVDDILDLAHDEDIEGTIVKVEQWIAANMTLGQSIEFLQLVVKVSAKQDWVESFLAALFLSNAGKIDLAQEEFYGPLYLSLAQADPSAIPAALTAALARVAAAAASPTEKITEDPTEMVTEDNFRVEAEAPAPVPKARKKKAVKASEAKSEETKTEAITSEETEEDETKLEEPSSVETLEDLLADVPIEIFTEALEAELTATNNDTETGDQVAKMG